MATRHPPTLTLVARNDDEVLHRRAALGQLDWTTRRLVPNVLAVIQGAGKPHDMIDQLLGVAAAIGEVDGFSHDPEVAAEIQAVMRTAIRQSVEQSPRI